MTDTMTPLAPRIRELAVRPYLAIRCTAADGARVAVDGAFGMLCGWMEERGLAPAGPPLVRMLVLDEDGAPRELEVGVPVTGGVRGDGQVYAAHLPPGRYVSVTHAAADRPALDEAREGLLRWMTDRGLRHSRRTYRGTEPICAYDVLRGAEIELAYLIA